MVGLRNPTGLPRLWFKRATSPAYNGATALVPPITVSCAVDAHRIAGGRVGVGGDVGHAPTDVLARDWPREGRRRFPGSSAAETGR